MVVLFEQSADRDCHRHLSATRVKLPACISQNARLVSIASHSTPLTVDIGRLKISNACSTMETGTTNHGVSTTARDEAMRYAQPDNNATAPPAAASTTSWVSEP